LQINTVTQSRGMVKQLGLGESNQKELTQKGTNIKKKAVTKSGAAGAAQHSKQSGVLPCRRR